MSSFTSLNFLEVTNEAGAAPRSPSSTPFSEDSEKEVEASSGKEVEPVDSLNLIGLQQKEERTTLIEEQLSETLEKESDEVSEKSSDFIVFRKCKFAESSLPSQEKNIFKDDGVSEYVEKPSSGSLETDNVKSTNNGKASLESREGGTPYIPKEKCQYSVGNGESYTSQEENESTEKPEEKLKKTVRVQSNENISDNTSVAHTSLKSCASVGTGFEKNFELNSILSAIRSNGFIEGSAENGAMVEEARETLQKSYVYYKGKPVGTLAAMDPTAEALNYNQVFVRDFVPSGLACLMRSASAGGDPVIVKNFLLKTLHLQGWEKRIDNFTLGEGVMPASFKVLYDSHRQKETLVADFGGSAIGRVAPVDSGFWWIILLRSYTKCTQDYTLSEMPEVQRGMKLILNLCLSDGFDTFPTLLCPAGCSMIDRRMGIYGYPIEIQALFYFALRCSRQMLKLERDGKELIERINKRITALSYHIQKYYWLDFTQLNNIYRYKTEEYSHTAVNKFNVIPESIPDWVFDFMPLRGGYLIGNVSPARMDFRWFLVGNCIAILSSLATPAQATAIMDLIEERWEDLIGEMPLKIVYPALEGHDWRTVTGFDPKNTRWSYHNGGTWPALIWLLTAACIKTGRPQIAKRAIELMEQRLSKNGWPEYYDGKAGRFVGKQTRKYQTWSIAGYLVAKLMIENPANLPIISLEEDKRISKPKLTRSISF
ncbi:putative alkaline/neutral invertase F [Gossypium australe]|uniref:Alkaline/neutral invertase n=1 Tax=Gossypium australe TaxID=47621 RepID=A0A5B6W0U1_9ROSI|nr:putative alkaline/neutral invertase F [Gossypium australe]